MCLKLDQPVCFDSCQSVVETCDTKYEGGASVVRKYCELSDNHPFPLLYTKIIIPFTNNNFIVGLFF